MRRILVILTSLAIALLAAPSNPALGAQPSTLQLFPPTKYVPLTLSSYAETNVDTDLAVGQSATYERRGQGFKVPVSRKAGRVNLWLKTSGAPTDNLTVEIQTDSGGLPSGTLVAGGTSAVVRGGDYPETNVDTDLALGQDATNASRAQGFTVLTDRSVSQVKLWLKKSGAPADNLTLRIETDNGGLPSGTAVTNGLSSAVPGSSVGSSYGLVTFSFSTPPQLTANTQYHLALARDGAVDSANYYVWGADQSSPTYSNGAGSTYPVVLSSYAETNVNTDLAMGQATANERRAQGFTAPTDRSMSEVRLWLKKSGAPADNLALQIQTDNGGLPSGTTVTNGASNTVPGSAVSNSYGWVTFSFSTPPQLTANTQYHMVLTRDGAVDSANYYVWGADQYAVIASYPETNVDTDLKVGYDTTNERRAQGFKVPANRSASQVSLWLKKIGAPGDSLKLQIQTDSSGLPSGTVVTNGLSYTVPGSAVGNSYGWVTFSFSTPPQLTANTQYHLVLTRSGSNDSAKYYVWGADQSSPSYGDGAGSVYSGSWATLAGTDHAFGVYTSPAYSNGNGSIYGVFLASYAETNVDTDLKVGYDTTNQRRAQGFKVPVNRSASNVSLWLKKSGAPGDNLTLQIQTDNGGLPSGTTVTNGASYTVPGSSVGSSYGWVTFSFSTPPQLTANTQYHLVLTRSGSVDNTNYYVWGADQSSPSYGDGAGSVYSGSWATLPGTDHAFGVYNWNWQATFPTTDHAFGVYSPNWQATSPSTDHAFRVIPASVSYGWVAFDFSTPPQLTAGTQYHLVLKRSGPVDNANYYVWGADQSSPSYGDGAGSVYSGSWATLPGTDHAFQVRPAFIVQVYAKVVGTTTVCPPPDGSQPCGLGGYGFTVLFDPTAMKYVSVQNGPFLTSTGRLPVMCDTSASHHPLSGAVGYGCFSQGNPPGAPTPLGPEGSGVLAEITFVPLAVGTTASQFQDAILVEAGLLATEIPLTAGNGSVTVGNYGTVPLADSDGDGCADIEEAGDNPMLGGNRNPNAWYDFYDVPVPSMKGVTPGTYTGGYNNAVNGADVLSVNTYNGQRAGVVGSAYEADVNGNTIRDGLEYDRSPSSPPNPAYDAGPPNGAISGADVLTANAENGAKCSLGHHG